MNQQDAWYQQLTLEFDDKTSEVVFIDMTRSGRHIPRQAVTPAEWTKLGFHQCPGCTFFKEAVYCPAALSLQETIVRISRRRGAETVTATSEDSEGRRTTVRWPLQQVGAVFVQIAVFSSGCPVGSQFRSMVRDLRPFSTGRELGRHLVLKQLLMHKGDAAASKASVVERLKPLTEAFCSLFKRLQEVPRECNQDALPNSIVHMHAMTLHLEFLAQELIEEIMRENRG